MKSKNITFPGKLTCNLCGKEFSHLGSHLWHAHKWKARDYKARFNLPYNLALISEEVYKKKVDAFNDHRDKYLKNITGNTEHQFTKGHTGQRRISALERKRFVARIEKVNKERKPETCPICNMVFNNLDSHLCAKHKLLRIK